MSIPVEKQFPLFRFPRVKSVPFACVKKWEAQICANHNQSLEQLAQRGGLSTHELYVAIFPQHPCAISMTDEYAWNVIEEYLIDWRTLGCRRGTE